MPQSPAGSGTWRRLTDRTPVSATPGDAWFALPFTAARRYPRRAVRGLGPYFRCGGTPGAAYLHVARTVTRRAERSVWALVDADPEHTNPLTARYLNRLSDLLFILGRVANPEGDVLWRPGGAAAER